jgi:3-oxoadipate enol-lactonase
VHPTTVPPPSPATARASGGVRLGYESAGRGPAVLLVMGFGMTLRQWWRTVPVLARHFRVLAYDHRGIGASDGSALPYSAARLADDAIAVLDAAGEDAAHVYGLSLGGMIAQEVALRHRERVRALVLGATTPGGARAVPGDERALSFFARSTVLTPEEAAWATVPYLYGDETRRRHGQRIAEDMALRGGHGPSLVTYGQQLLAAVTHNTAGRLDRIAAPTLVVHGEEDRIVAVENARRLANAIPGAELEAWDGAGHFYVTDEPRADEHVARFLLRHTPELGTVQRLAGRARSRLRALWRAAA